MRKVAYLFLAVVVLGCSDETKELSLTGQVKGKVLLYTEFGITTTDQGATVSIEGTDKKVTTGADGSFVLDVQTGTYNIVFEKEGYVKYVAKGAEIVGGNEPIYLNVGLYKPVSTTITNFTATYGSGRISTTGKVTHNSPFSSSYTLYGIVYFSSSPNVSSTNYERSRNYSYAVASGSTFSNSFSMSYPSGSKVYAITYATTLVYTYNPDTDRYDYINLGVPSNVVSIQIP